MLPVAASSHDKGLALVEAWLGIYSIGLFTALMAVAESGEAGPDSWSSRRVEKWPGGEARGSRRSVSTATALRVCLR